METIHLNKMQNKLSTHIRVYSKALRLNNPDIIREFRKKLELKASELVKGIEIYKTCLNRDTSESTKKKIMERINRYELELDEINKVIK